MRGYFAIGVEGISKAANLGNLIRSAHAFGASFCFTLASVVDQAELDLYRVRASDTSESWNHLPVYGFATANDLVLPDGCSLVGVELVDDSIPLPSFRHPLRAAYVLGPEKSSLSPGLMQRCDFVVRIPTAFCINVGVAGAIVMYDRMISLGRFAERPVRAGGPVSEPPPHIYGKQKIRNRRRGLTTALPPLEPGP